jgi:hypothetical protein
VRTLPVSLAIAAVVAALAGAAGGCKGKKAAPPAPPVPVAALAVIPADAAAVVGMDIERLARSRLVARAVAQMFERDPELRGKLTALATACTLELPAQIRQVHLAIGPVTPGVPRASMLVATGALTEASVARCLQAGVGGGEVTVRQVGARSLYQLATGGRAYHFGFGQDDTIVFGSSEAWVMAGLGDGAKVLASPALGAALATVDREASLWAVAAIDPELGLALTNLSSGAIASGPTVVAGTLDPLDGVRASATFTMKNAADARALASYASGELALGGIAAAARGLGPVLAKVEVTAVGAAVQVRVDLTDDEVKQVLSAIDRGRSAGQDAQPAADADAGAPDAPASPDPNPNPPPPTSLDAGADAR